MCICVLYCTVYLAIHRISKLHVSIDERAVQSEQPGLSVRAAHCLCGYGAGRSTCVVRQLQQFIHAWGWTSHLQLDPRPSLSSFDPRPLAFLRSDKQRGRSPLPHRRLHLIHLQRPCISSHVAVSHHFTSHEHLCYSGLCLNYILSFAACYPSHHLIYHADQTDPSNPRSTPQARVIMAVSAIIPFLVGMMLLTGCANTILTKYQDQQCVRNCDDPNPSNRHNFEQPVIQT